MSAGQDTSHVTESYVAPSVSPSVLTRFGHHHVPPSVPTNFGWTFNPQNEIVTFRRLPKSAPSPLPQPPMYNRGLPSETLTEDTDLPNAAPAYIRSLQSPCHNQIPSRPNHPPVLRLSKRHRDALKVKLYHLYANILSMNCCFTPPNSLPCRVQMTNPFPPIICGFVSSILADTTISGSISQPSSFRSPTANALSQPSSIRSTKAMSRGHCDGSCTHFFLHPSRDATPVTWILWISVPTHRPTAKQASAYRIAQEFRFACFFAAFAHFSPVAMHPTTGAVLRLLCIIYHHGIRPTVFYLGSFQRYRLPVSSNPADTIL
eukprot:jgi/Psemu1/49463/gm1.49463_g